MRSIRLTRAATLLLLAGGYACSDAPTEARTDLEEPLLVVADDARGVVGNPRAALLGRQIFLDEDLSLGKNQSCASCHDAAWGFTGPDPAINAGGSVYEGSVPGRFGNRRPPTAAYATLSPVLHFDPAEDLWMGGNFWNGRATGQILGNPAADQAMGPFLNPAEQALPDYACVVYRVSRASYKGLYRSVFGRTIFGIDFPSNTDAMCQEEGLTIPLGASGRALAEKEYQNIALAVAAFENSRAVNAFSSKFDHYRAGLARLTRLERIGLELFEGKALCSACHPSAGRNAMFTDFSYDNLGTPANPRNPALLGSGFRDFGLGETLDALGYPRGVYVPEIGKHKVPTLRNIDLRPFPGAVKSYMHNGAFRSLEEVVHFYNTRDVLPACASPADPGRGVTCWPVPEIRENVNVDELGDLGLGPDEEAALVAFLRTLSDGWRGR